MNKLEKNSPHEVNAGRETTSNKKLRKQSNDQNQSIKYERSDRFGGRPKRRRRKRETGNIKKRRRDVTW